MPESKELKGFAVENESIKVEGLDLVGNVDLVHVGKIGSIKVKIEGNFELIPMVHKAIDKLEELIPGDQKAMAEMLKNAIKLIKL